VLQAIEVTVLVLDDVHHPRGQTLLSLQPKPEGGHDGHAPPPVSISEKGAAAAQFQVERSQQYEVLPIRRALSSEQPPHAQPLIRLIRKDPGLFFREAPDSQLRHAPRIIYEKEI
jgi:hypothetical protein